MLFHAFGLTLLMSAVITFAMALSFPVSTAEAKSSILNSGIAIAGAELVSGTLATLAVASIGGTIVAAPDAIDDAPVIILAVFLTGAIALTTYAFFEHRDEAVLNAATDELYH